MTTLTLPAPKVEAPYGWDGKKRRTRKIKYVLPGTEHVTERGGRERKVVMVTVGHSTDAKQFYAVANKVTEGRERGFTTEAYFPFDGVTLQRRPVARYSEKALEAFTAEVLAVFPDLVAGTERLQRMFTETERDEP